MAAATTLYDVRLQYIVDDRATRSTKNIEQATRSAARSAGLLSGALGRVGGVVAGAFGVMTAKRHLVDFNSGMEQMRLQAAGLMQMNMGGTFADNLSKAEQIVGRLQQEAKTSVGTTQDMASMFSNLVQPLSSAGAKMEDFVSFTKGAVVAAKALGVNPEVAAFDIDQAMRGQMTARDQLTNKMLGPLGFAGEAGRSKFNALSQAQRLATLQKALTQDAVKDMAKAQGESWEGVLSTLQDNLQMFLGNVGKPLFKALTEELKKWNVWLEKNEAKLAKVGQTVSDVLLRGLEKVKTLTMLIADHWGKIAVIWGTAKLAGMAAGFSAGGGAAGLMGKFSMSLSSATTAASALAVGLSLVADHLMEEHNIRKGKAYVAGEGGLWSSFERMKGVQSDLFVDPKKAENLKALLAREGFMGSNGGVNAPKVADYLAALPDNKQRRELASMIGGTGLVNQLAGQGYATNPENQARLIADAFAQRFVEIMAKTPPAWQGPQMPDASKMKVTGPVNVTIQRIEVASDDPDRFVIGLEELAADALNNPSGVRSSMRDF